MSTLRSTPAGRWAGDQPKPHPGRKLTEAEFTAWVDERTRAEWVNGEVTIMSPVSVRHDEVQVWFLCLLRQYVETHDLGRVCGSEVYIRLPRQHARHLSDCFFVAKDRLALFTKSYFDGAPDLILEVVSPESASRDFRLKYQHYEAAGVGEYWIISPDAPSLEVHTLKRKAFHPLVAKDGKIASRTVPGFYLRPEWITQGKLPPIGRVLHELRAE